MAPEPLKLIATTCLASAQFLTLIETKFQGVVAPS